MEINVNNEDVACDEKIKLFSLFEGISLEPDTHVDYQQECQQLEGLVDQMDNDKSRTMMINNYDSHQKINSSGIINLLEPNKNHDYQEECQQLEGLADPIDNDKPLKGTVIFVDVRAESENRSKAISREVEKLGSAIASKVNGNVTHVVFKDGRNATLSQVKKYPHIHLVSVLWVDSCKTTLSMVDESLYPAKIPEKIDTLFQSRTKRVKSLQPKTLEEDVNNSAKKAYRRRRRLRFQQPDTPPDQIICLDSQEYIKSSDLYKLVATPRVIPDTPWIFKYINSSDHDDDETLSKADYSNGTIDLTNDGSLNCVDTVTKSTNVTQLSPTNIKKLNSTMLKTSIVAKTLLDELNESIEGVSVITTPLEHCSGTNGTFTESDNSDASINLNSDGSFVTKSIDVTQLSPIGTRKSNSLTKTFVVPKRLAMELTESNEGVSVNTPLEQCSNEDSMILKNDASINMNSDDSFVTKSIDVTEFVTKSNDVTELSPICIRKFNSLINTSIMSKISKELSESFHRISVISPSEHSGIEGNNKSVESKLETNDFCNDQSKRSKDMILSERDCPFVDLSKSYASKKKKKLLSKAVPFKDSPFEEDDIDNTKPIANPRRHLTAQTQKFLQNGNVYDAFKVINYVQTSKKILERQKKYLLKPFKLNNDNDDRSSDCSFKTVENLQLRCPKKRGMVTSGKVIQGNFECAVVIKNMNLLEVDPDFCCTEQINNKDGLQCADNQCKDKQRRSSGIDFKVMKNFTSLHNKNNRGKKVVIKRDSNKIDYNNYSSYCHSDYFDDEGRIDLNVSFVHDERDGLIIASQDNPSQVMNIGRNNEGDSDSGISDSDVCGGYHEKGTGGNDITNFSKEKGSSTKARSSKISNKMCKKLSPIKSAKPRASLVSTSLHHSEQIFVKVMVKRLGGFVLRTNVANDTTHVIAGSERRTLNILHAIINGCWILSPKWVADSIEKGIWQREEDYEMHQEFPIAKISRISRVRDGKSYLRKLFATFPPIYVAEMTAPPSDEMAKFITLCGGQVTNSIRKAGIGVGTVRCRRKDLSTVTEKWVLDSISSGRLMPTKNYESFVTIPRARSPEF